MPRKEKFDFIKPGVSMEEVRKKSGKPFRESFSGNETELVYEYCQAPEWKDVIFGAMTATIYAWDCDLSKRDLIMKFKDGTLYQMDESSERADYNRGIMAGAIQRSSQQIGDGLSRQSQQNMYQQNMQQNNGRGVSCTTSQYGNTAYTNCR
jgi:hypothetical protein